MGAAREGAAREGAGLRRGLVTVFKQPGLRKMEAPKLAPLAPKLVRQRNNLGWQNELLLNGYTVVDDFTLKIYKESIYINGQLVECPPSHSILLHEFCQRRSQHNGEDRPPEEADSQD